MSRYNEQLLDVLENVTNIRTKEGEPFKARAFKNAHDNLISINKDIKTVDDLNGIPGFGPSVITICNEFITTGHVKIVDDFKNNPINIFSDIYGIGPKNAEKLVKMGITTLEQLTKSINTPEMKKLLNNKQLLGLQYYDDIKTRIPRIVISEYEKKIKSLLPSNCIMEILGSYRRGALESGDIDVIFTTMDKNIDEKFNQFIQNMVQNGLINKNHILALGESKCLVIAKLEGDSVYRRIDFLCASPNEFASSLLYFTGSKYFNTVMRQWTVNHGMTMNEHGIYHLINGKKGPLVDIIFHTEEDIFNFLGLVYKLPTERKDGRDVIPITYLIDLMRKNGINSLVETQQKILLNAAKYTYYNKGESIISDAEFDLLDNSIVGPKKTGAVVIKDEVILPYFAPSLDKIKPDSKSLDKWKRTYKGPYVISCKLDGDSALEMSGFLATRGNGKVGQNISGLLKNMPNIPNMPNKNKNRNNTDVCIRGELIIKKSTFLEKYAIKFKNVRNMVSGIVNRNDPNIDAVQDLDLVPYEVLNPVLKPSDQFAFLISNGWKPVWYTIVPDITNEMLSELLINMREKYEYDIDGLVVVDDNIHPRPTDPNKTPDYAFAFKMILSDQQAEVIVTNVIWVSHKDGYLKPTVKYEMVNIRGVECTSANGQNARFIRDNKIGVGAIIRIIRSGDVIPNILGTVSPAIVPLMPDPAVFGEFHWNETGVDIVLNNPADNEDVLASRILRFFRTLEVADFAEGNIARLIEIGVNSVPKILAMSKTDWLKVRGFQDKKVEKIYSAIQSAIQKASLIDLMVASNLFGRGFSDKKINSIMSQHPLILQYSTTMSKNELINLLINIPGIADKSAVLFVDGIKPFLDFIHEAQLDYKLNQSDLNNNRPKKIASNVNFPSGKNIVLSGFRDKDFKTLCDKNGIELVDNITKNTAVLIVKDIHENTGKIERAKSLGIPILTMDMFHEQYF